MAVPEDVELRAVVERRERVEVGLESVVLVLVLVFVEGFGSEGTPAPAG